jgi:hypothetical protein
LTREDGAVIISVSTLGVSADSRTIVPHLGRIISICVGWWRDECETVTFDELYRTLIDVRGIGTSRRNVAVVPDGHAAVDVDAPAHHGRADG